MRERWVPLTVLVVALTLLVGSGLWAASRYDEDDHWGPWSERDWEDMHDGDGWEDGPGGMMRGAGPGRLGIPGDGRPADSLDRIRERAEVFADGLDLGVGEVMRFTRNGYAELTERDGTLATEVLVDPDDGSVMIEYGPAMMWNTDYGMHRDGDEPPDVSAAQARSIAEEWLADEKPGTRAGEAEAFPGYYTLHSLRDGRVDGMLSVNADTGDVWYHRWHGRFIEMEG